MSKNPNWSREELILAMDLYIELDNKGLDKKNPKIITLSQTLKALPIHRLIEKVDNFRSPSSVTLKLSNFRVWDKNHPSKGMKSGNAQEKVIWDEFINNQNELRQKAIKLKELAKDERLIEKIYQLEDEPDVFAEEGAIYHRVHQVRERDAGLTKRKKAAAMKATGKLQCEVCDLVFSEMYGDVGDDFIECHHINPLAEESGIVNTTLEDLALVCSNCHRMIHRGKPMYSIDELREIVQGRD